MAYRLNVAGRTDHQLRVEAWMRNVGQTVREVPGVPTEGERVLRAKLLWEETLETIAALGVEVSLAEQPLTKTASVRFDARGEADLPEVADGCCDVLVVTLGTLAACGVPDAEVMREVLSANDRKLDGPKREDGKQLKPEGWKPPDVAGVLRRAGWGEAARWEGFQ